MVVIQTDLTVLQTHTEFAELDGWLNRKLNKMEKFVIDKKRGEMNRVHIDYENNNVYTRKKKPLASRQSRKNSGKHVSFSDQESDLANYTIATTASESSPDRPSTSLSRVDGGCTSGNPCGSNIKAKKKSATRRHGEEERETKTQRNTPYTLRGKKQ